MLFDSFFSVKNKTLIVWAQKMRKKAADLGVGEDCKYFATQLVQAVRPRKRILKKAGWVSEFFWVWVKYV